MRAPRASATGGRRASRDDSLRHADSGGGGSRGRGGHPARVASDIRLPAGGRPPFLPADPPPHHAGKTRGGDPRSPPHHANYAWRRPRSETAVSLSTAGKYITFCATASSQGRRLARPQV